MDLLIKCSALALFSSACGLVIKQKNPELGFGLAAVTAAVIFISALKLGETTDEIVKTVTILSENTAIIRPIMKCVGISIITKVSSDLCRQTGNTSAAYALDFSGTVCALAVSTPIIVQMMKLIGELV